MTLLNKISWFIFLFGQCSAFTVNYAIERVEGVESRIDTLSKLRRSDLAEIFGTLSAIKKKVSVLDSMKDIGHSNQEISKDVEAKIRKTLDYILKGIAEEKLGNARIREKLVKVNSFLTSNISNSVHLLQNKTGSVERQMINVMNTQLIIWNSMKQMASQIDILETEMTSKIDNIGIEVEELFNQKLEGEKDWMAWKINNLETELELRNKKEELMMSKIESLSNEIDTIKANLTTRNGEKRTLNFASCSDLLSTFKFDGVYKLSNGMQVFCDQTTDGGGWTVFQRRQDGYTDFERVWTDYKNGFGNLFGEFWLGNENIHVLTATGNHELRIDMEDFEGKKAYAKYSTFKIKSEEENYALEVSGYSGTAGDSLSNHNAQEFSTKDRDNDEAEWNCAEDYRGAWWYYSCHSSNLNGFYYHGPFFPNGKGIVWYHLKRTGAHSLKFVEMKLR